MNVNNVISLATAVAAFFAAGSQAYSTFILNNETCDASYVLYSALLIGALSLRIAWDCLTRLNSRKKQPTL